MSKDSGGVAVSVRGLSKAYDIAHQEKVTGGSSLLGPRQTRERFWALKDVSFDIEQGDVVGIIGRNGAGKSTLLKVLSRIVEPTSGEAVLRGRLGSLLEVGTGFHPELTGRENVYLNGSILGMTRREIDRHFDAIVDFSGTEKFLDTPVKRYSSGMYVRLAFAVAAHLNPEILIVDEVLAVGDSEFQKKCMGKMQDVASQGRTILFVSHNMAAIRSLTQQCAYLKQGSLVTFGRTADVLDDYLKSGDTQGEKDVSGMERFGDRGERARFLRIRSLASASEGFLLDETLAFEVELSSNISASNVRLGATLSDRMGTPILNVTSPAKLTLEKGDAHVVRFSVNDTRLAPGSYTLSMSVYTGGMDSTRSVYDVIKEAIAFDIQSVSASGKVLYNWNPDYGFMNLPESCVDVTEMGRRLVGSA